MKNVIEILEKQYQSFINQERDWNFFLGLADYVKFINECPDSKQALTKVKESKSKEIEIIDKLEKEAVIELQKIKRELLKIIKTENFTCEGLPEALLKLEDYEKGKIDPNHYKSSRLDEGLRNLIKVIAEKEGKKYDEELVKKHPLLKHSLSKKLLVRMGKSWELGEKRETELWGAYDKLKLVYRTIHNKEGEQNLIEEMEIIKNDGERYTFSLPSSKRDFSSSTDFRIKEFKKDNYKLYATRIHNFLIQKLNLEQEAKTDRFNEEVLKTQQLLDKLERDIKKKAKEQEQFEIKVKDRQIWINDYLLSKPFGVGSNFEFFEYIRSKPPDTLIARNKMPNIGDGIGYGYTKEAIKKKGFIKILNELGFKDQILKAFFYKRSKNTLIYRGDKITKEDLNKAGIKFSLFIKELELAHAKNSPE